MNPHDYYSAVCRFPRVVVLPIQLQVRRLRSTFNSHEALLNHIVDDASNRTMCQLNVSCRVAQLAHALQQRFEHESARVYEQLPDGTPNIPSTSLSRIQLCDKLMVFEQAARDVHKSVSGLRLYVYRHYFPYQYETTLLDDSVAVRLIESWDEFSHKHHLS